MTEALAPVARAASSTVLKTGTLTSKVWPPLPAVTPPTTAVPYSSIWRAWNEPSRPVMPCTRSRVLASTKMLMRPPAQRHHLLDRLVHVAQRAHADALEDADGLDLVGAGQPDDDGHVHLELAGGGDDAVGHVVGPGDAAENVEQNRLHVRIGGDDLERVDDLLGTGAAAD